MRVLFAVLMAVTARAVENPAQGQPGVSFQLTSSAFKQGEMIPGKYACNGRDVSPALAWSGVPDGTRSLALIMEDPDSPAGTWVHWVLYDLPATLHSLYENQPKKQTLPNGARQGLCWGAQEFRRVGYYGPCPPSFALHRYYFRLYALDKKLNLKPKATKVDLLKAMEGHILGRTELMGRYERL